MTIKQFSKAFDLFRDGSVEIRVTPGDCKDASYFSNLDCPLARAVKRELGVEDVVVGGDDVEIEGKCFDILDNGFCYSEMQEIINTQKPLTKVISL